MGYKMVRSGPMPGREDREADTRCSADYVEALAAVVHDEALGRVLREGVSGLIGSESLRAECAFELKHGVFPPDTSMPARGGRRGPKVIRLPCHISSRKGRGRISEPVTDSGCRRRDHLSRLQQSNAGAPPCETGKQRCRRLRRSHSDD